MMFTDNFNMAIASIRANRLRSLLTMSGIIIGVVSVITSVSLAEGVKQQVSQETSKLGTNVVTIRPASGDNSSSNGLVGGINKLANSSKSFSTLSEQDLAAISNSNEVVSAVPLGIINGVPSMNNKEFSEGVVIGTSPGLPQMLKHNVEFGGFFADSDSDQKIAVIGSKVAEKLFGEFAPLGRTITIRGQEFVVRGVFEKFDSSSAASSGVDLNYAVFIPYPEAKKLSGDQIHFYEVLARSSNDKTTQATIGSINQNMKKSHGGEHDFTVLAAGENAGSSNNLVKLVTTFVGSIAIISMLIGGVGIMNIMLVSITERTREIGIRKAIGASDSQIRTQFLTEATVLSVWGAVIGVAVSAVINLLIRIFTQLQPVIVWETVLYATAASIVIGVIFGAAPAIKAARKDPIDSLRP